MKRFNVIFVCAVGAGTLGGGFGVAGALIGFVFGAVIGWVLFPLDGKL